MTLQQFKYMDAIATCGSLSAAARQMFVTQPALTESVKALEDELKSVLLVRTSRGVSLTREGEELLASARQILSDVALVERRFTGRSVRMPRFAISSLHYSFAVQAFMDMADSYGSGAYDFAFREEGTREIFEDVVRGRSEVGVVCFSKHNTATLVSIMKRENLTFEEMFTSVPHVVLSKKHQLAKEKLITLDQLDGLPYVSFAPGDLSALCFSEAILPPAVNGKNLRVTDRGTMCNLISGLGGYTVASKALSKDLAGPDFVAIPLMSDEEMRIGALVRNGQSMSRCAKTFLDALRRRTRKYAGHSAG